MTRTVACEELSFDLQIQGRRLRAKTILPPGRDLAGAHPTLVFLHEGLGSISQWRDVPLSLVRATGLPALIYDRYGYGLSEARLAPQDPDYLEREAEQRLPEVLAACGIQAPILVGHSDGASIALLFAARYPRVPLAVISEAAHVFIEPLSIQGIWKTLHAYETTRLRAQLQRHHGAKVDSTFHGWSDVWLSPRHQSWSMVARLSAISAPVLAIQGLDDPYGSPAQVQTIVDRVHGPAQAMLIPECAHVPHFQARDQVLARIAQFLDQTLGKKSWDGSHLNVENEITSP